MQGALLPFSAEAQPGSIGRADIGEIKTRPRLLSARRIAHGLLVADLGMVVAHLGVFLDTEGVLLVTSDRQAGLVDGYHSIASGAFEDVQLAHGRLGSRDNFELR